MVAGRPSFMGRLSCSMYAVMRDETGLKTRSRKAGLCAVRAFVSSLAAMTAGAARPI